MFFVTYVICPSVCMHLYIRGGHGRVRVHVQSLSGRYCLQQMTLVHVLNLLFKLSSGIW